jgi:hypothetical protein
LVDHLNRDGFNYWSDRLFYFPHSFLDRTPRRTGQAKTAPHRVLEWLDCGDNDPATEAAGRDLWSRRNSAKYYAIKSRRQRRTRTTSTWAIGNSVTAAIEFSAPRSIPLDEVTRLRDASLSFAVTHNHFAAPPA